MQKYLCGARLCIILKQYDPVFCIQAAGQFTMQQKKRDLPYRDLLFIRERTRCFSWLIILK